MDDMVDTIWGIPVMEAARVRFSSPSGWPLALAPVGDMKMGMGMEMGRLR